jgi:(1->4)-alpha-D-glucan 1-alpha-D-glucosylmutase
MTLPRATLRLQFCRTFTLDDAAARVDAFAALGVSHVYASPLLRARAGSAHGYDVVDPDAVSPELGGIDALRRLVARLRERDMGLVLDIVPNHMAASEENPWWFDVLEHGRASRYAGFFDVDWTSPLPGLHGKVLAPYLATPLDEALARMRLVAAGGRVLLEVDGRRYPLAPQSPDEPALARACAQARAQPDAGAQPDPATLRALLARQHYVLADWREAPRRLNWRRFFDITDLVALRVERDEVFEAVHARVLALYAEGLIDGVRVDHVDGLADPERYCRTLRARLDAAQAARPAALQGPPYLVVEKILAEGEQLPRSWRTHGTTGYDFMDQSAALLHDARGAAALDALWSGLGGAVDFDAAYALPARREVLSGALQADLERMAAAWQAADGADASERPLRQAAAMRLAEHLRGYRTYFTAERAPASDRRRLAQAAMRARDGADAPLAAAVAALREGFMTVPAQADARVRRWSWVGAFQQLTPAVAAKALEDTAFYRYGRLLSRNEVGSDPSRLALPCAAFHAACRLRQRRTPHAMLAVSTHDHKRGADARARLAVLSELPQRWAAFVRAAREANAALRRPAGAVDAPDPIDEYLLLQTLVGAWPPDLDAGDADALDRFVERVLAWQRKALREAKRRTSWTSPDAAYEEACAAYLRAALSPRHAFLAALARFVGEIAPAGALNGLALAALHLAVPGVPDVYQGCVGWDHTLVDPDNRRAVEHRGDAPPADPAALLADWRSGAIKRHVVMTLLEARRRDPALLRDGSYHPVRVDGARRRQVVAFERRHAERRLVVAAARLSARLVGTEPHVAPTHWQGTSIAIAPGRYLDLLSGRTLDVAAGGAPLREVLAALPVAALLRQPAA